MSEAFPMLANDEQAARRQVGGLTGDVFGAIVGLAMAVTLTAVVISS
jgi:cobalamin synthase